MHFCSYSIDYSTIEMSIKFPKVHLGAQFSFDVMPSNDLWGLIFTYSDSCIIYVEFWKRQRYLSGSWIKLNYWTDVLFSVQNQKTVK